MLKSADLYEEIEGAEKVINAVDEDNDISSLLVLRWILKSLVLGLKLLNNIRANQVTAMKNNPQIDFNTNSEDSSEDENYELTEDDLKE